MFTTRFASPYRSQRLTSQLALAKLPRTWTHAAGCRTLARIRCTMRDQLSLSQSRAARAARQA